VDIRVPRGVIPRRAQRCGSDDERARPVARDGQGDVRLAAADVVGEQAAAIAAQEASNAPRRLHLVRPQQDRPELRLRAVARDDVGEQCAGVVEAAASFQVARVAGLVDVPRREWMTAAVQGR
jgi:hypothetical protein